MILFLQMLELLDYRDGRGLGTWGPGDLGTWVPGEGGTSAVLTLDKKIGRLCWGCKSPVSFGAVSKQTCFGGKYIFAWGQLYICALFHKIK